jgi:hypothetical protein
MLYIFVFSLQDVFWKSYILQNLYFANSVKDSSKFLDILYFVFGLHDTRALFALTVIFFLLSLSFLIYRFISQPQRDRLSDTSIFFLYSLIILTASIYSVVKPGRLQHYHYLLFLIFPAGFLIGVLVGEFFKVYKYSGINLPKLKLSPLASTIILIMIIASTLQLFLQVRQENPYIDMSYHFLLNYTSPASQTILKYASQNGSMAIWGWDPTIYVETGIIPATRDTICQWQMFANPQQQYYIRRFADDLLKSETRLFIDSTAGFAKSWERFAAGGIPQQSPEDFPDVAIILKKYYTLVDDVQGFKIYIKKSCKRIPAFPIPAHFH